MTPRTDDSLTGYFPSVLEARQAMVDLITAGFPMDQVRLIESEGPPGKAAVQVVGVNGNRARAQGILRRDHARVAE